MIHPEPLVFQTSRWKAALSTAIAVGFVLLGIWMMQTPAEEFRRPPEMIKFVAFVTIIGFGAAAAVGFARTMQPDRLLLDHAGFRVDGVFSRPRIAWSDIDAFILVEVRSRDFLAYRLKDEARGRHRPPFWKIGEADGFLPSQFEKPQHEVLSELTRWRRAYDERGGGTDLV